MADKNRTQSSRLTLQAQMQRAIGQHQRGQLASAGAIYEEVLRVQPRNFDALHLLGVIAAQSQDPIRALSLIDAAIRVDPNRAEPYCNKASALMQMKRIDQALAAYDTAIRLKPDYFDAHCNRGVALRELRRLEEAAQSYDRALAVRADHAPAHFGRGQVLADWGRPWDALASFDRAIALRSDFAPAHCSRGNVLKELAQPEAALRSYDRAIACDPRFAEAYVNRGLLRRELRQFDAALTDFDAALRERPNDAAAHLNRGAVLIDLLRWQEAVESCGRALQLNPRAVEALLNRGNALRELGQFDAALEDYARAIAIKSDYADAHLNRGALLTAIGRIDDAVSSHACALTVKPDWADAHLNRSLARLLAGDFERGWPEYEWRWKTALGLKSAAYRAYRSKLWLGEESIAGRAILLDYEQGLGDTIQFCRFAPLVATRGARVILRVQEPLRRLLESLEGVSCVLGPTDPLPELDFHCPLMSLPLALKVSLSSVPAAVPYLKPSAVKAVKWGKRFGTADRPRVGLVWSGGYRADQPQLWAVNNRRNIPLTRMATLADPDVDFFSLQKGEAAESELAALEQQLGARTRIIDWTAELQDFADTAALVEHLDLLISVDTSTAHLAAALAKPVWVLNRYDTCWRWLRDRSDSPWYPTLRLYRQPRPGDWEAVIAAIRTDLRRFIDRWRIRSAPTP